MIGIVNVPRKVVAFSASVVLLVGLTVVMTTTADAGTTQVTGRIENLRSVTLGCTSSIGICFTADLTGSLNGRLEATAQTAVPSPKTVGMTFLTGDIVIRTASGNLYCESNALVNNLSPDGEFSHLCPVVGGTGRYANASGYLQTFGTTTSSPIFPFTVGQGEYRGVIRTP